jgi:hypothetical protein
MHRGFRRVHVRTVSPLTNCRRKDCWNSPNLGTAPAYRLQAALSLTRRRTPYLLQLIVRPARVETVTLVPHLWVSNPSPYRQCSNPLGEAARANRATSTARIRAVQCQAVNTCLRVRVSAIPYGQKTAPSAKSQWLIWLQYVQLRRFRRCAGSRRSGRNLNVQQRDPLDEPGITGCMLVVDFGPSDFRGPEVGTLKTPPASRWNGCCCPL